MPAYSFKERFCPMVVDGSKPHTIRNRRKYPPKISDTLYLYFGLRTKWVRKLREERCSNTHSLAIGGGKGIVFYSRLLTQKELKRAARKPLHKTLPVARILTEQERNRFAWMDGFRPEGSTKEKPGNAYYLMLRFWTHTHILPWAGDIIYWEPAQIAPSAIPAGGS